MRRLWGQRRAPHAKPPVVGPAFVELPDVPLAGDRELVAKPDTHVLAIHVDRLGYVEIATMMPRPAVARFLRDLAAVYEDES